MRWPPGGRPPSSVTRCCHFTNLGLSFTKLLTLVKYCLTCLYEAGLFMHFARLFLDQGQLGPDHGPGWRRPPGSGQALPVRVLFNPHSPGHGGWGVPVSPEFREKEGSSQRSAGQHRGNASGETHRQAGVVGRSTWCQDHAGPSVPTLRGWPGAWEQPGCSPATCQMGWGLGTHSVHQAGPRGPGHRVLE